MKGQIICARCSRKMNTDTCHCGYAKHYAAIRLSHKGERKTLYYDRQGRTLRFDDAFLILAEINKAMAARTFDWKDWTQKAKTYFSFKRLFEIFLTQKDKKAEDGWMSKMTVRAYYSYYIHHYKPFYDLDTREIRLRHLQEWLDALPSHLSQKCKKNMMDCLKTFFAWLKKWEGLEKLPDFPELKVTIWKQQKAIPYHAQIDGIKGLPEQHQDIFMFLRETGLRIGEVCALQIRDIDLDLKRCLICRNYSGYELVEKTKGKSQDYVPLSEVALKIAEKHARGRFGMSFLFIHPNTRRGYKQAFLRDLWAAHGIPGITLHEAFRHSTISDWAKNANAFQVQELARHSDIRTSTGYVHNAMTDLEKIVNRTSKADTIRQINGRQPT